MDSSLAVREQVEAYLAQDKVQKNHLVGRGIRLIPPFSCAVTKRRGHYEVTVKGASGENFVVLCDQVKTSKYRDHITFVLNQENERPIIRALVPLQLARRTMLDNVPPNTTMSPAEFYEMTAREGVTQINARRRWGELRTEYGFETTCTPNTFSRGGEFPVTEPNLRPKMSKLNDDHFESLYEMHKGICAKCGKTIRLDDTSEGEVGLLDHRMPVPVGGGDEIENLQLFCTTCNNLKSTACQRCPLNFNCESCTWAHPEKFHDAIVVRLTAEEAKMLVEVAAAKNERPEVFASTLFKEAFSRLKP